MLAASVGIRHGSRCYGVCVDCADKSQPGGQEGVSNGHREMTIQKSIIF